MSYLKYIVCGLVFAQPILSLGQNLDQSRAELPKNPGMSSGFYVSPQFNSQSELKSVNDTTFKDSGYEVKYSEMKIESQSAPGVSIGYQTQLESGTSMLVGAFIESERTIKGLSVKGSVKTNDGLSQDFNMSSVDLSSDSPKISVWGLELGFQIPYESIFFPAGGKLSSVSFNGGGLKSDEMKNQIGLSTHIGVGYRFNRLFSVQAAVEGSYYSIKWPQAENATLFSGVGAVAKTQFLF